MITNTHLISGETFIDKNGLDIGLVCSSDDEINEKYNKGEIRIVTEQARYPIDSIETMLDSKRYILNPEYQRRKRWNNTQKSRLIESLIMNVPISPIFLYEIDYSTYEVIDGEQRLTAIYDFYKGKFNLEGLEYWQELNGRNYQNLPGQVRRGIDRRYLSSIVLLQETAKNEREAEYVKHIVFERLNSGGDKLTPQETRNALHNGKFNQVCIKLAQNDYFRKMWKLPLESEGEEKLLKSESYRKMEDVELVLRFFAYRHIDNLKSPVDKFLDEYLKQANNYHKLLETEKEKVKIMTEKIKNLGTLEQELAEQKVLVTKLYGELQQAQQKPIETPPPAKLAVKSTPSGIIPVHRIGRYVAPAQTPSTLTDEVIGWFD
jgi:hypothetical protein